MQKHDDIGCIFRRYAQHAGTVWAIPFAALTTLIATTGCLDNAPHVAAAPTAPAPARNQSAREKTEWGGAADAPARLSWQTVIAPKDEPGERLVISGTVFAEDGVTPAKNVLLYVYHTNAKGVYPKRTADNDRLSWRHGYLRGWIRTGADGKYRFHTIRPGSYPGRTEPAHIHATVSAPGYPEYWIEDYLFEGDPLLSRKDRDGKGRSGFPHVLSLKRDKAGLWHGARNIRLKRGLR